MSSTKYNPLVDKELNNSLKDLITSLGKWLPSSMITSNSLYLFIKKLMKFLSDCEP